MFISVGQYVTNTPANVHLTCLGCCSYDSGFVISRFSDFTVRQQSVQAKTRIITISHLCGSMVQSAVFCDSANILSEESCGRLAEGHETFAF